MFFCVSHVDNINISSHFMTCVMGQKGRKRERSRRRERRGERGRKSGWRVCLCRPLLSNIDHSVCYDKPTKEYDFVKKIS
jgi:hypothetical protein